MKTQKRWPLAGLAAGLAAGALALSGCSAGDIAGQGDEGAKTLTFLVDNSPGSTATAKGLAKAFEAKHPGVTVKIELRPGGADGDNIIKTRLSTGDMTDVFMYNSGSLFHAIDPQKNLVPLDSSADTSQLEDSFLPTVKEAGKYYGTPFGTAMAGAVLYNRAVYSKLGLSVPKTWDQFMTNNKKIKAAGIAPVIQTYQDTWTSQLFVLGDYHNVAAKDPSWATKYTKNQVHYAQQPALEGFDHLQQVHDAGYENKNYGSAKYTDGIEMLAKGQGAQYPILTNAISDIVSAYPKQAMNIGAFPLPGNDASKDGMTVWPGIAAVYVPKSTQGAKLKLAQEFQDFVGTTQGCDASTKAHLPGGPYLV